MLLFVHVVFMLLVLYWTTMILAPPTHPPTHPPHIQGTPNTPSRVSGFAGAVVGALGSTVEGLANQLTLPADVTAMDALRCV